MKQLVQHLKPAVLTDTLKLPEWTDATGSISESIRTNSKAVNQIIELNVINLFMHCIYSFFKDIYIYLLRYSDQSTENQAEQNIQL